MKFNLSTKGFNHVIDITKQVSDAVEKSNIKNGICLISCPGSTCGITTIEYEQGVIQDLKKALESLAPMNGDYVHYSNGYAHIRSALINPFLVVPVENKSLALGTWQQIIFIDFDNRARERKISVKVIKRA